MIQKKMVPNYGNMEGKIEMKVPHKSTDGDDSFDVRCTGRSPSKSEFGP